MMSHLYVIIQFITYKWDQFNMRFRMPNFPCDFEIPDDWLAEAGMDDRFTPTSTAYRSTPDAKLVALVAIEPVDRRVAYPKDWRGFDRGRLISVLKGFVSGPELDPVPLFELRVTDCPATPERY